MDKQTLSHYGWIVIVVLVLAVMLAFATPFGTYVGDAVVATTKGFGSITEHKLNEDNIKNQGDKWEDKFENGVGGGTSEPERPTQPEEPEEPVYVGTGLLLPEGSIYTMKDKEMCNELYNGKSVFYGGERLPKDYKYMDYDTYEYGEYKYTYEWAYDQNYDRVPGWKPKVLDKTKESYSKIPTTILGEPIIELRSTFEDCTNMKCAPTIPNSAIDMHSTFEGCTSLTTPPRIPDSVLGMSHVFKDCTSLKSFPYPIPESVDNMWSTFDGCTSLTGTITINCSNIRYGTGTPTLDTFKDTILPIKLKGSCPGLKYFTDSDSANNGNVTLA